MAVQDGLLLRRRANVLDRHGQTRLGRIPEAPVLKHVQALGDDFLRVVPGQVVDQGAHLLFVDDAVDVPEAVGEGLVEDDPSGRGGGPGGPIAVLGAISEVWVLVRAVLDPGVEVHRAIFESLLEFVHPAEHPALADDPVDLAGHVVATDEHVLGGGHQGPAMGRAQHIIGRQHQHPGLGLRFGGQGQVNGHLVPVEVGVERGTDQRVDTDRLALDEDRFEGLNAQPMEGRRPI